MRRLRFSIAGLVGLVICCGVGFAALRSHSIWWVCGVFDATMILLLFSVLGVIHRRGEKRAFWAGFATFGWGYYLLAFGFLYLDEQTNWLLTTKLLDSIYGALQPTQEPSVRTSPGGSLMGLSPPSDSSGPVLRNVQLGGFSPTQAGIVSAGAPAGPEDSELFRRIGHCLFLLVFAVIGGEVSRRLYLSRVEAEALPAEAPAAPGKVHATEATPPIPTDSSPLASREGPPTVESLSVAAEAASRSEDAMTRDDDGDRVGAAVRADGPRPLGSPEAAG